MNVTNKKEFENTFLNSLSGDCLSLGSPHLSYMSRMSGYNVDNKPSSLYDTIIGDYSENTQHKSQNQKL